MKKYILKYLQTVSTSRWLIKNCKYSKPIVTYILYEPFPESEYLYTVNAIYRKIGNIYSRILFMIFIFIISLDVILRQPGCR